MAHGRVEAIFVAEKKAGPIQSVPQIEAKSGQGLIGDRHFESDETQHPSRELTLIEAETFDALRRDLNLEMDPSTSRRNILTRGVPLNHLVGREFLVGDVLVQGVELCEPCGHLQKLTSAAFREGLVHRGGLRAAILKDGPIRVGDSIDFPSASEELE